MHELYYWIALRLICGVGNVNYKNLITCFGSPDKIFGACSNELEKVEGLSTKTCKAILNFKENSKIENEIKLITSKQISIVTLNSPDYPASLKNIYDPPPFLYIKGQIKKADNMAIAVVGSRISSEYGRQIAEEISRKLASRGITIISGLARGIDSCAHHGALSGGGRTIAVLGSGIDVIYPRENKSLFSSIASKGAVVSEYPMGTEPNSYNFPARNRIISGLSAGVLVVEASPKSGSLITARLALEQGRDVFAIPGNVYSFKSRGTNNLLKNGAQLVESADEIIEQMQFKVNAYKQTDEEENNKIKCTGPDAQTVYALLQKEPAHIDEIIIKSGLSSSQISSALLELEINSLINQLPGKRFARH